jgi:hypothetical protein
MIIEGESALLWMGCIVLIQLLSCFVAVKWFWCLLSNQFPPAEKVSIRRNVVVCLWILLNVPTLVQMYAMPGSIGYESLNIFHDIVLTAIIMAMSLFVQRTSPAKVAA